MSGIIDLISEYNDKSTVRFHMPGHKGRETGCFFDTVLPYDVTELPETDDLYELAPGGCFDGLCMALGDAFYSGFTLISASGATLGIQTALLCAVRNGAESFLFDRSSHISAIRAAALCGIDPDYTDYDESLPDKQYDTVYVTSPDYYGRLRNIIKIREQYPNALLIVDNAHGSHLAFFNRGILHPNKNGADIVIDSIHKTLPAMTSAALIHFNNNKISKDDALFALRTFASTSPSFIIASSVETMLGYMLTHKDKIDELIKLISDFEKALEGTPFYIQKFPISDPFRISLTSGDDLSVFANAAELDGFLKQKGIVSEFNDGESVVLIPSVMTDEKDFDRLTNAIKKYSDNCKPINKKRVNRLVPPIQKALSPREALLGAAEQIDIQNSLGRTVSAPVYAYPPGVAIIPCGMTVNAECIKSALEHNIKKVTVCK